MELNIKIEFNTHTVDNILNYPDEDTIKITFKNVNEKITINKISVNGINANIYYNTSFSINNSEVVLTSIYTIDTEGTYILKIDDLYIRSLRSNNWHCSTNKEDFIFQYEFTRSSFVDTYRDRNHIGFEEEFIPCFGCSMTFGAYQPDTDAWPYLLAQETGKNFLNLGIGGLSADGIYNNLKLLYSKNKFNQCVILFPGFERRVIKAKIDNDLWIRIPTPVSLPDTINTLAVDNTYHFYKNIQLQEKMRIAREKIIKDITNQYSKRFLLKIIKFCKDNNIELYCSGYHDDVHDYLSSCKNIKLLPKFPAMDTFTERGDDTRHPHKKHYQLFVDKIKELF